MTDDLALLSGDRGTRRVTNTDIWALGPDIAANLEGYLRAEAERRGLTLTIWALRDSEYDYEFTWEPAQRQETP